MRINNMGEYNSAQLDHEQLSDLITELHNPVEWPDELGPDLVQIGLLKAQLHCVTMDIEDYDSMVYTQKDALACFWR